MKAERSKLAYWWCCRWFCLILARGATMSIVRSSSSTCYSWPRTSYGTQSDQHKRTGHCIHNY